VGKRARKRSDGKNSVKRLGKKSKRNRAIEARVSYIVGASLGFQVRLSPLILTRDDVLIRTSLLRSVIVVSISLPPCIAEHISTISPNLANEQMKRTKENERERGGVPWK